MGVCAQSSGSNFWVTSSDRSRLSVLKPPAHRSSELNVTVISASHRLPAPPALPVPDECLTLFFLRFIYFKFLAVLGLPCCARAFSSCGERGLCCGALASHHSGFSCLGAQTLERAGFSSCGA